MRKKAFGRKHKEETNQIMSLNRKGENNSFYGKAHTLESKLLIPRDKML